MYLDTVVISLFSACALVWYLLMTFCFSIVIHTYRSKKIEAVIIFVKILRLENVQKKNHNITDISDVPEIFFAGKFASLNMPTYPILFKYVCAVCTGFKTICLRQDQRLALQSSQRYSCDTIT